MKLLILGGTRFVGRHVARVALAAGHEVVLFNRGLTAPGAVPEARLIAGDRRADIGKATGDTWDCVVDVSGYTPEEVSLSTTALRERAAHYLFISTISVYPADVVAHADEDEPTIELNGDVPDSHPLAYGGRKAECERLLRAGWDASRLTIVRPTIVVGPHDPTDRFTYWVRRIAQGGRIAVPARGGQPVQIIDARDLATFVVALATGRRSGTYNACGPVHPVTVAALLDSIARTTGSDCEMVGVDDALLTAHGRTLPLTLPADGHADGMFQVSNQRALGAGMRLRSIDDSVAATLAWDRERGLPELHVGVDATLEDTLVST